MLAATIVDNGITDARNSRWVKLAVRELRTSIDVAMKHYNFALDSNVTKGTSVYDLGKIAKT